jgi:hypothetical protein
VCPTCNEVDVHDKTIIFQMELLLCKLAMSGVKKFDIKNVKKHVYAMSAFSYKKAILLILDYDETYVRVIIENCLDRLKSLRYLRIDEEGDYVYQT